jgi:hypothetical protein
MYPAGFAVYITFGAHRLPASRFNALLDPKAIRARMMSFSTQQRRALQKHLRDAPPSGVRIEQFLQNYYYLESLVRIVGKYYRHRNVRKPKTETHESLNKVLVERSLRHYGVRVTEELVDLLLSSDRRKRNEKSARKLRDGIVHNWSKEDREEVLKRYEALQKALQDVIEAIRAVVVRI